MIITTEEYISYTMENIFVSQKIHFHPLIVAINYSIQLAPQNTQVADFKWA